ncbi:iron transporter [Natronolimnohabitans sp. A-GB9]|uniref:iron transporter n=1 Tax=Natronolimnohabitans sp. A-GB9 TaxID=3069757 RepID=UPI0027B7BD8C|nr:iron transporter [Natronolimnohabitans sp. A-GB9]MDQ2049149.1 iron transporter [Natronolimnohabitans sp. A-GB9]
MRRRAALAAGGSLLVGLSAGCLDLERLRREDAWRELVVDPPDGAYVPSHADEMVTYGMATEAGREITLAATRPHSFWVVADGERNRADVRSRHAVHLMVDVRDAETGQFLPAPVTTTLETRAGDWSDDRSLWPMLSQQMGAHYGDNVPLDGDGAYVATVEVGTTGADVLGEGAADLVDPATAELEFEYESDEIEELERRLIDEDEGRGEPGALEPMAHDTDDHDEFDHERAASTRIGTATADDVEYTATLVGRDDRSDAAESELAMTARTAYNAYPLPFASLSAAVSRAGERIAGGALRETIGPELGHHYRTAVDPSVLERGDELTISVESPPQLSRHEGYENAFLETESVGIGLESLSHSDV